MLLCMLGDTQRASHSVQIQFPFNRLCSHTGLHVPDPVRQKWQWVRRDGAVSRCWKESKIAVGHSWLFVRQSVRRHTRPFRFQFSFALSPSVFLFDDTNACQSHTSVHPSSHPSIHPSIGRSWQSGPQEFVFMTYTIRARYAGKSGTEATAECIICWNNKHGKHVPIKLLGRCWGDRPAATEIAIVYMHKTAFILAIELNVNNINRTHNNNS